MTPRLHDMGGPRTSSAGAFSEVVPGVVEVHEVEVIEGEVSRDNDEEEDQVGEKGRRCGRR
jgi:hypothetical protein